MSDCFFENLTIEKATKTLIELACNSEKTLKETWDEFIHEIIKNKFSFNDVMEFLKENISLLKNNEFIRFENEISKYITASEISFSNAVKVIVNEFKKDKSPGSVYHSWKCNIACVAMDVGKVDHEISNKIADSFLTKLIGFD